MKTRTRVFAWFALAFWVLLVLVAVAAVMVRPSERASDGGFFFHELGARRGGALYAMRVLLVVSVMGFLLLGPLVGWIGLLKQRVCAWWLLIIAYATWLLLIPRMASNVALWGSAGVVVALFLGLPLLVLLTDRPSGWTGRDAAQAAGDSRPRITRAARGAKKLGPLTLIELLIILAILGILVAVLAPAVQRSRRAAGSPPAASQTQGPDNADSFRLPR
jgi:hypothetical protein